MYGNGVQTGTMPITTRKVTNKLKILPDLLMDLILLIPALVDVEL